MHKCPKCGTEFEGKFCSNCGRKTNGNSFTLILYEACRWLPVALLAVLAVLTLTLPVAPLAGMEEQTMNGYYIIDKPEAGIYQPCVISLIVFGGVSFLYSFAAAFFTILKKRAEKISPYILSAISLAALVLSAMLIVNVKAEKLETGAFPIVLMVFSILFLLTGVGCIAVKKFIDENLPYNAILYHHSAFNYNADITSIVLGENTTRISSFAFYEYTGLKSIHIPNSVSSIGNYAFAYCRNLTEINFNGTIADWKAIKKDLGWKLCSSFSIHCTDGDVN